MKNLTVGVLAKVVFILFLFLLCYFFYTGITSIPSEGDSLGYHIPIAQSIISGHIMHPNYSLNYPMDRVYFPSASEVILVVFMFFHMPLNLYNVFALICLFFSGIYLSRKVGLARSYSLVFAITICTLNAVLRWVNAQTVDIWLAIFFMMSLGMMLKPEKSLAYFLKLGVFVGFLFGTKYSGSAFATVLLIIFAKDLFAKINFRRVIVFLIPFSFLGLFWYFRNFIITGNPIYPEHFLFFKGIQYSTVNILDAFLHSPIQMLNAMFLEYRIWSFALLLVPICILFAFAKKKKLDKTILILFLIGTISFILFLFFPSAYQDNIYISNYRLAYPSYIIAILVVFLFAKNNKKEELLSIVAVSNMFLLPTLTTLPKLTLIYIPLAILFFKIKIFKKWFS
jgi:hypothetical protein